MPDISQPESGGVDPEADRKIKAATDAENAVAPYDRAPHDRAQDDSTRRHNVAHDSADTTEPTDEQAARPWSRRHFLRATGAGAALIAAACGRQRGPESPLPGPNSPLGTPTPTSYDLYLPQVSNGGGVLPTAEAVALVPEPTLTPTPPKATDTPAPPTPTPTPMATPFPPGPRSKLGIHVERNVPELFDLLETGAVAAVTTLELDGNFAQQIKDTSPSTKLIGRITVDQPNLATLEPLGAARAFVDRLLPLADEPKRRATFDAWIAYNEPVANTADEMKRLAEFESERTRLLAERGIRSIIANFGTGQPLLELWEHFLPAVQTAKEYDGWLGLHEYSAPTIYYLSTRENQGRYPGVSAGDTGWLTLRYRQVYNQFLKPAGLAIPLIFTEMGVDGLVAERPGPADARGWQDFQSFWAQNGYGLWGPGAYVEQLVWYDEAMRQDDYVIGACIYGLGTSAQWLSYDINGPAAAVLRQYLSVHV